MTDVNGKITVLENSGQVSSSSVKATVDDVKLSGKVSADAITGNVTTTEVTGSIVETFVLNPTAFVPYTGATTNVDLGAYTILSSRFIVDGATYYIDSDGTNLTFTDPTTGTKTLAELAVTGTGDFNFTSGDVDLYITTAGNDTTGDGSIGSPWATPVKLINEMALYRTDGTITGNIADGTYTTPNPAADWMTIPAYAQGDWEIIGNTSTPTNVVFDGDDANPTTGRTMFRHENPNIELSVSGINFKNTSQCIVMSGSRIDLQYCQFDSYKYAVNMGNFSVLKSLNGASTLTFNGYSSNATIGIRMLDSCIVKISSNVRMTGHRYDFSGAGYCFVKLDDSFLSTYESVLDATYGTSAFIFSRDSALEIAMPLQLDGNGHGNIPISITSRSKFYSFKTFDHEIIDYAVGIFFFGVNSYAEQPISQVWGVSGGTPLNVFADYSVVLDVPDSFGCTLNWAAYGDIYGYDNRYPSLSTGTAAPSSTPAKLGDIYTDTAGGKVYISTGTTNSADWKILN